MNNIIVNGLWKEGIVLDKHVVSSTPVGHNQYGHMDYHTVRTPLGDVVYKIKYNNYSLHNDNFISMIKESLDNFTCNKKIDYIIGVPPTNLSRRMQPVDMIGDALSGYMKIPYLKGFLMKKSREYVKNLSYEDKKKIFNDIDYNINYNLGENSNILLIDDIFQSGSTLQACTKKLLDLDSVNDVYMLAMTKTKN